MIAVRNISTRPSARPVRAGLPSVRAMARPTHKSEQYCRVNCYMATATDVDVPHFIFLNVPRTLPRLMDPKPQVVHDSGRSIQSHTLSCLNASTQPLNSTTYQSTVKFFYFQ